MTRYDDARWGCLAVLLLIGSGFAGGYIFSEVVADPRQSAARAATAPEKHAVSTYETPTTLHTLRGARTACTALVEQLEGLHEVSVYRAQGGGP